MSFLAVLAMCLLADPSRAQHSFQRTITVDPSGNADFTTIQGAIDSIADNPTDRWTILIHAGEYDESVTLDGTQENIDLVGVDRDAVVIAPTGTDENGLTITSGTEASRNNTIRNITIRTTDGHGVEIRKGAGGGDQTPRDIVIEDCVVEVAGTNVHGILGTDSEAVTVRDSQILSTSDDGVVVGDHWTLDNVSIEVDEDTATIAPGLLCDGKSGLLVTRSTIASADDPAATFTGNSSDCSIQYCILKSKGVGGPSRGTIRVTGFFDSTFFACRIINDATARSGGDASVHGVFVDSSGSQSGNVLLDKCEIVVHGDETTVAAIGVKHDFSKLFVIRDCTILVSNSGDPEDSTKAAAAFGVQSNAASSSEGVLVIGGSIFTSTSREREPDVFDLGPGDLTFGGGPQFMSGTRLSKWRGPVQSGERPRSAVQRTIAVASSSGTAILAATSLTATEQEITPTGQPDVYRTIRVTGSFGTTQTVYVIGTNFAGDRIAEAFVLNGGTPVNGNKPFATVTKIILPAQTGSPQSVSVGYTNRLGLQMPIAGDADVIQIGRKASAATSYTIETLTNFTIDENFATVEPSSITSGDSFEFVVEASQ